MQTQPELFSPHANTSTHQRGLFPDGWQAVTGLTCDLCDSPLVRTAGYLCCPRGHGRLKEEAPAFETPGGFWEELE